MNAPLAEMLRYDRWAMETLLTACAGLDDSVLGERPAGISGTIGELFQHVVGAQQTFVLRTQGQQDADGLGRGSAWPGWDDLRERARRSSDALVAVAEGLEVEREVDLPYWGRVYRFPVSFFLTHAVEHGVEHRTELKVGLAQLGIATPELDGWAYAAAAGHGREVS